MSRSARQKHPELRYRRGLERRDEAPCPTPTKMVFETKHAAKVYIRRMKTTKGEQEGQSIYQRDLVRPYRCRCGAFHITTQRAKQRTS